MRNILLGFGLLLTFAARGYSENRLNFTSYEILFTNPDCQLYKYPKNWKMTSVEGSPLTAKPKDAYCKAQDALTSMARSNSPQNRLENWISDARTREVFFASLSFSNGRILKVLCDALEKRGVRVSGVIDSNTDLEMAEVLKKCAERNGVATNLLTLVTRGNSNGLGFQHNKLVIINPTEPEVRVAFGSGNLSSSGLVLHHENWHFITLPQNTFFVKTHLCLAKSILEAGLSKRSYIAAMTACRKKIPEPPEDDIQVFFSPVDGSSAQQTLLNLIETASSIDVSAHRFSNGALIRTLMQKTRLNDFKGRLIMDDDVYWAGQGEQVGPNISSEYRTVLNLLDLGFRVRFVETNHNIGQLNHAKYLILRKGIETLVFTGAGNLTKAAFSENFENFYVIKIPHVAKAFNIQFNEMWNEKATPTEKLPSVNRLP